MTNAERQAEFRQRRVQAEKRLRDAARAWYLARGGSRETADDPWYLAMALEEASREQVQAVPDGGGEPGPE
jgi:fructoselysine-6-P-deglycase FrlB-like protein